jgi:hypothetical protein
MMRRIVAPIVTLALALGAYATAPALPGQRLPVWLAWAKANPVLQNLKKTRDEMSGGTIYNKTVLGGGLKLYFSAEPGYGDNGGPATMFGESLSIQGVPDSYDLRLHRGVAAKMAGIVYGAAVAADVQGAKTVGDFPLYDAPKQRQSILKGKLYMYQMSGPGLSVAPLSTLAEALKNAKFCATNQCGD